MNNKTDIDVQYVSPLKKICMTIGELPSSYLETMSYYEMLVWFTEFLKNQVIPTINNNAEAVKELQSLYEELRTYVNNYFDNLDVQEEINNKLDEMADSGQLTDIIAQYLGLAGMIAFDKVQDMKEAQNLVNGSKCRTLGFNSYNDGGGAYYRIRQVTNDDVIDEKTIIEVYDDLLVAELLNSGEMNVKQFGAYGDGTHDDTLSIQTALNFCKTVHVKSGTYMVNSTTHINLNDDNNLILDNDAIIKSMPNESSSYAVVLIQNVNNVSISGGTIQGEKNEHEGETGEWGMCLSVRDCSNVTLNGIKLIDGWGDGLYINNVENVYSSNLYIKGNRRNGISVISATNYHSENDYIEDIGGTNPEAGVDLEPNETTEILKNIKFTNLITKNCTHGFVISAHELDSTSDPISVEIDGYTDYGSDEGMRLIKDAGVKGTTKFNNLRFYENSLNAIQFRNWNYNTNHSTICENVYIERSSAAANDDDDSAIMFFGTGQTGNITFRNVSVYQTGIGNNVYDFYCVLEAYNIAIINPMHVTSNWHLGNIKTMSISDEYNVLTASSTTGGYTTGRHKAITRIVRTGPSTSATTATFADQTPVGFHCKFVNISAGNFQVQLPSTTYCQSFSASAGPLIKLSPGAELELERFDDTNFIVMNSSGSITV